MPRPTPRAAALVACLSLALVLVACSPRKALWQAGIPFVDTAMRVVQVSTHGPYLETRLAGPGDLDLRLFLPDTEECRVVAQPGNEVSYLQGPSGGGLRAEGETCTAAGIGSLVEWRARHPRDPGDMIPRAQATFRAVHADEQLLLARGRFPLAGELDFPTLSDVIAAVPASETCQDVIARGVASMEYRPVGPEPLVLLGDERTCPIVGLIRPRGA